MFLLVKLPSIVLLLVILSLFLSTLLLLPWFFSSVGYTYLYQNVNMLVKLNLLVILFIIPLYVPILIILSLLIPVLIILNLLIPVTARLPLLVPKLGIAPVLIPMLVNLPLWVTGTYSLASSPGNNKQNSKSYHLRSGGKMEGTTQRKSTITIYVGNSSNMINGNTYRDGKH